MSLFSVIVPVYKVEKYIKRCIDSILSQSFQSFELILVDDGSPDRCGSICDEYAKNDKRIRVIHKSNGGLASARNAGINAAQGEYICFVDSDDFVDDRFLEVFAVLIEQNKADIIHSGIKHWPSGKRRPERFPVNTVMSGIEMIESNPTVSSNSSIPFAVRYCFRRAFLENHSLRFNESIKYAEDSPFNLSAIILAEKMVCTEEITYHYCVNSQSITQTKYKPTMVDDLDYYYSVKKQVPDLMKKGRDEYERDITNVHIFFWIPSCINSFRYSPKGLRLKDSYKLMNADFVKDGIDYLLKKNCFSRRLQKYYFFAVRKKLFLVHLFWKFGDMKKIV